MKMLLLISVVLNLLVTATFAQSGNDKDWTLDPKTSTLIPKYLGKIKILHGKAIIGERELKVGSKVYSNDLIQTSDNSYIVMEMIDLTTVTLGPNSDFKVSQWSYRTKNDRNAEFDILKGQWRALVRSKAKEEDQLKIKTPVASLGIRGTELMVNVLEKNNQSVTQVALLEGSVHLESNNGKQQDLIPGDHVSIVGSDKSLNYETRKMNALEVKSFYENVSPGIPRLLPPEKKEIESSNPPPVSPVEEKPSDQVQKPTKSVQENLRQLNQIWNENQKKPTK